MDNAAVYKLTVSATDFDDRTVTTYDRRFYYWPICKYNYICKELS